MMSKYESMSDFEINKLVALSVDHELREHESLVTDDVNKEVFILDYNYSDRGEKRYLNYCASWRVMGPIIEDNLISITPIMSYKKPNSQYEYSIKWEANHRSVSDRAMHDNPLRAVAIIYLESLEQNNE